MGRRGTEERGDLMRLVGKNSKGEAVYSPQIHQDIARHRQADMLREAHRERLAAVAAAKPNGPGKLALLGGIFSRIAPPRRSRAAGGAPAIDSAA
jgi:hypothetical protein